jgi:hypothetical protein
MAHAVKVIYTFKDNKGKMSTVEIKVPTGLTIGDYLEFATEMGTLLVNVSTGQIVNVGIAFTVDIPGGWPSSPGLTSDVEEKGALQFQAAGNWYTGITVPTLAETVVVDGSDNLDQTDGDVSDLIDAMVDGITLPVLTTLVKPCDSREADIEALIYAREVFRASGKRA